MSFGWLYVGTSFTKPNNVNFSHLVEVIYDQFDSITSVH